MSKYEILLFDLDGTLTDPGEGIKNAVEYALSKRGLKVADKNELNKFIGPPLVDSFSRFYGFTAEESDRCVEDYRVYYADKGVFENRVYDGIPDLLGTLKRAGKRLIIATSKPECFAKQVLDIFDLTKHFDFVAGATLDRSRNQKVDVIKYALKNLGEVDKSKLIMIGDRDHDIKGAKAVGIDSLGVLYGYGDREEHESAGATYIAESVEDILRFA